jgi:hypothetical protein
LCHSHHHYLDQSGHHTAIIYMWRSQPASSRQF